MNRRVQVIRGFSILAVVMIHTYGGGIKGVVIRPFINYAVGMFLFLSGYLTVEKKVCESYKAFCQKRIIKIVIPYIIWSCVYTVVYWDYRRFVWNILTFSSHFSFYYIFVYIQMVLVTPLAFKLLNSRLKYAGFLLSPVSIIIIRYIAVLKGWILNFPWTSVNMTLRLYTPGRASCTPSTLEAEQHRRRGCTLT